MVSGELGLTMDEYKKTAFEQFLRRKKNGKNVEKINNGDLQAGSPMYYYCDSCGIPTEMLPEDYLFPPYNNCSQCEGLKKEQEAKIFASEND